MADELKSPEEAVHQRPSPASRNIEEPPLVKPGIKVRLMVGPVSIDTEAEPGQIVELVKRMVQEFTGAGIIKLETPAPVAATPPTIGGR